jgi:hypothetical protein
VPCDDEETPFRIEALLGCDSFRARLLARSAVPRILRTLGDAGEGREIQREAKELGLRTFLVDDHALETDPVIEPVDAARTGPDGVVLQAGEVEILIGEGSLELAVASWVEQKRVRTSSRITMMSSEPGATPGVPRVVRESRSTGDHRGVLDLYVRGSATGFRVREESTRMSGAGMPEQPSSMLRFLHLVRCVRRLAPDAAFDDGFSLFDDLEASQARRVEAGAGTVLLDGVRRFERYSRLLWLARRTRAVEDGGGERR